MIHHVFETWIGIRHMAAGHVGGGTAMITAIFTRGTPCGRHHIRVIDGQAIAGLS
ncbi:unnamed protein product [Ciceribacter sp. T2.26MG-112.2]|nr:unnamed protein product [Ciceribacter naphthalenivorans]